MNNKRLKEVHTTLAFLRSVIMSGEPMTNEVRNAIDDAIYNLREVDKDIKNYPNEAERLLLDSGSLPSKDEVVGKGFDKANGSEYNRRHVLRDADDDLYYTGWMDCFDWLVGNDR